MNNLHTTIDQTRAATLTLPKPCTDYLKRKPAATQAALLTLPAKNVKKPNQQDNLKGKEKITHYFNYWFPTRQSC